MKWGYMNRKGEIIIARQFDYPADFKKGLAKVRLGSFKDGTEGYIDHAGKFVWQSK